MEDINPKTNKPYLHLADRPINPRTGYPYGEGTKKFDEWWNNLHPQDQNVYNDLNYQS